jgi:predicted MFS family arabinose efflux permease
MPASDRGARTRRAHLVAAGVLTLGLVGDAMLYAVLPASAATYGLGAVGVALALSLNRFVRLLLNPLAARALARTGLRTGTLIGAVLAAASTAAYALAPGLLALLAARVAWGASFATLRLTMLAYATLDARHAPRRLGNATALQELAPAVLLVLGTAVLGWLGVRGLFLALAVLTLASVPLALALPLAPAPAAPAAPGAGPAPSDTSVPRTPPWGPGGVATAVAFGVDGMLMAGVVLALIALGWSPLAAAQTGGALLATRKVVQIVVSALAGRAGERLGVARVVRAGTLATALSLAVMAAGPWQPQLLLVGAVAAMIAASLVTTLVPAVVAGGGTRSRLAQLAWLANARDLGAALGAAAAPLALMSAARAESVSLAFGLAAALVLAALAAWRREPARDACTEG